MSHCLPRPKEEARVVCQHVERIARPLQTGERLEQINSLELPEKIY